MVRLFREAGAIIVGTTAMTEFGVTPLGYLDLGGHVEVGSPKTGNFAQFGI